METKHGSCVDVVVEVKLRVSKFVCFDIKVDVVVVVAVADKDAMIGVKCREKVEERGG